MSVRVSVEVYTSEVEVAYHGHEGAIRKENIEIAPPAVLRAMATQLRRLAIDLEREADTRAPGTSGERPPANRAQRRAAAKRGRR